jgi:hypothetical protein
MSRYIDDTDQIVTGLDRRLEDLLSAYWPSWIKNHNGSRALLTPKMKPGQKRPTSSFTVHLRGQDRGSWYRFSQKVGGGNPVSLVFYGQHGRLPTSKEDWTDAYTRCREFLGMRREAETSAEDRAEREKRAAQEREKRDRDRAAQEAALKRKRELRALTARSICDEMVSIVGTLGEAYMVERGLPPISEWPWKPDGVIGFHPELEYEALAVWEDRRKVKEGPRFPAVCCRVQDAFGETTAVWQIFLDPVRPRKNETVENAKMGLGPAVGGAVRIGGIAPRIGVAEGYETTLGDWFMEMCRYPIWSTLSTAGMAGFEVPPEVSKVDIYPDGDRGVFFVNNERRHTDRGRVQDPPGLHAGKTLAERLRKIGCLGVLNEPPLSGDGLDLWNSVKGKMYG